MTYKERVLSNKRIPAEYYKVKLVAADISIIEKNDKNTGDCVLDGKQLYLIGTEKSFGEELLVTEIFNMFLNNLKNICEEHEINKIAFPKILLFPEGKSWSDVVNAIEEVFMDTDIEILIYK